MGNFMLGKLTESMRYAEQNLALAERIGTQIQTAFAWSNIAFPLFVQGRIDEAYQAVVRAYKIAEIASFFITLGYANAGLALYHGLGGSNELARTHLAQGWACNPNAVAAGMLNWAASLIAAQTADLAEARQRLTTMYTLGLLGQVSGFLLLTTPVAVVYLVEIEAYNDAANLLGLMDNHALGMVDWAASWPLFVERKEMLLGSWAESVENGRLLDLFTLINQLLNRWRE